MKVGLRSPLPWLALRMIKNIQELLPKGKDPTPYMVANLLLHGQVKDPIKVKDLRVGKQVGLKWNGK